MTTVQGRYPGTSCGTWPLKRGRSSIGCPLTRKSEPARATLARWAGSDGTTDGIAVSRRWTTMDVWSIASPGQNSPRIQVAASGPRGRCIDHLQNRWSASLAMSTDGSFPSRPRHFELGKRCPNRPSLLTEVVIASLQPDRQSAGG